MQGSEILSYQPRIKIPSFLAYLPHMQLVGDFIENSDVIGFWKEAGPQQTFKVEGDLMSHNTMKVDSLALYGSTAQRKNGQRLPIITKGRVYTRDIRGPTFISSSGVASKIWLDGEQTKRKIRELGTASALIETQYNNSGLILNDGSSIKNCRIVFPNENDNAK